MELHSLFDIISFFTFFSLTRTFNLEPRIPVMKLGKPGTYFGYSVAEHIIGKESNSRSVFVIGAPKDIPVDGVNNTKAGAVYLCELSTNTKDCKQIDKLTGAEVENDEAFIDDRWLGVTVASQGDNGLVLACAHRHVIRGETFRWGTGICYTILIDQSNDPYEVTPYEPCYNKPVDKAHEQYGFCAVGTSGLITKDSRLVFGTPGPYTWRGTVYTYNLQDSHDSFWESSPVLDNEAPVEKYSYLGMAVTYGPYFSKNKNSYVAGAPRANGTGQVVFLSKSKDATLNVDLIIKGEQFASSFGYTLATLDCNKDGYPDLVVGAPFYHGRETGGAVYIYMNSKRGLNENTVPKKLTGKDESRFGFGLASAGDINKDGFEDLAVGAPYEEGGGSVYIYIGSADGIPSEPTQIIKASDIPQKLRDKRSIATFGYSLSGGLDLDGNGYPDLLVGAYESDSVYLLRARPVIDIETSVTGKIKNINPLKTGCDEDPASPFICFSFNACFKFGSSSLLSRGSQLKLKYIIEAETFSGKKYYRVRFNSSKDSETPNIATEELTIPAHKLREISCTKELVYLKNRSDIQNAIKFKMTYSLIQEDPVLSPEGKDLEDISKYPILNQKEASKIFEASFLKNCGANDICESDLKVDIDFILPREEGERTIFYLGEDHINVTIKITNPMEPAYDALLYIHYPNGVKFINKKAINPEKFQALECTSNATTLTCDLDNPLTLKELELQFRFSSKGVSDEDTSLSFNFLVTTTSKEMNEKDNTKTVTLDVVKSAELTLRGVSTPEQAWYGGEVKGAHAMRSFDEIGTEVTHIYEIINNGPWSLPRVEINISWPYEAENRKKHGKYLLYITHKPELPAGGYCDMKPDQVNSLELMDIKSTGSYPKKNLRKKRELVVQPEEVRMEGKTVKLVKMRCDTGTARCFHFSCYIKNLAKKTSTVIKIKARLWNATLVEDYPSVDQVSIYSTARIVLDPALDLRQKEDDDIAEAETKAYPDASLYQKTEEVALWIIIVSAIAGLVLLIILIFILFKVGFFKRKRPGYEPAPTSEKEFPNNR